jgi:hypothetical protein
MNKQEIVVGQQMVRVCISKQISRDTEPVTVTNVGRKYFTVQDERGLEEKYNLDDGMEVNNYLPTYRVVASLQVVVNEEKRKVAIETVKKLIDRIEYSSMSIDEIESVSSILNRFQSK